MIKNILLELCVEKIGKYYFKLSKEHIEEAIEHGFSTITLPFTDFDKIYESDELFSIFKIRIPKFEEYDEEEKEELLQELGITKFDEMIYLEKTKGELLTDHFIVEKEQN